MTEICTPVLMVRKDLPTATATVQGNHTILSFHHNGNVVIAPHGMSTMTNGLLAAAVNDVVKTLSCSDIHHA